MRKYNDIKADFPVIDYPREAQFTKWYGYKAGTSLGTFDTKDDAIKAGATVTEKSLDEKAFKAAKRKYQDNQNAIVDAFCKELRDDYPSMSDEMFSAIYSMAYDRGHSSGHDEVALYFDDYYDFAMKVIEISKKE